MTDPSLRGRAEVWRALGFLSEFHAVGRHDVTAALGIQSALTVVEHTEVFVLALYPHGSIYLGAEGMIGGDAGDRFAGFWRALGLAPPPEPDHLSTLLGLYSNLLEASGPGEAGRAATPAGRAAGALLTEHIVPWVPVFAAKIRETTNGALRAWADLVVEATLEEVARSPLPARLPLHLRAAPGAFDAHEAGELLAAHLLVPVRTGMILTRLDLARAADDLGLGLRAGERLFVLRSLLGQDAHAVLSWLAAEARRSEERHAELGVRFGPTGPWWRRRAGEAASQLASAAKEARDSVSC